MVMYQPKIGKSLLFSYKPPQKKTPPQKDLEKASPERMTENGLTKPKKSCEPQKVPFRTFIKPYSEKYPHCRRKYCSPPVFCGRVCRLLS